MLRISNQRAFQKEIKKAINAVPELQTDLLRKVSFDALRLFQEETPEDTGRARGSWNTTVDLPPSTWIPAENPGGNYPKQTFNGTSVKPGSLINVTSNLDYMEYLDKGSSSHAALGIVNPVYSALLIQIKVVVQALERRHSS